MIRSTSGGVFGSQRFRCHEKVFPSGPWMIRSRAGPFLFGLDFVLRDAPHHHMVLAWFVGHVLALVHVGDAHGQHLAVLGEVERGDRAGLLAELRHALLLVHVPDVDQPVGAARRHGAVDGMDHQTVHGVDHLHPGFLKGTRKNHLDFVFFVDLFLIILFINNQNQFGNYFIRHTLFSRQQTIRDYSRLSNAFMKKALSVYKNHKSRCTDVNSICTITAQTRKISNPFFSMPPCKTLTNNTFIDLFQLID